MSVEKTFKSESGSAGRTKGNRSRFFKSTAIIVLTGFALTACKSMNEMNYTGSPALTGTQQYPISVERGEVTLSLDVAPGMHRLSSSQRAQVSAFISQYRRSAGGQLQIKAPSGTMNEMAALNAVADIRNVLGEHNIPSGAVRFAPYGNGTAGDPPVIISYMGFRAVASDCGNWSENLAVTTRNRLSPNFGCAYQHNLAAMVADPRDFERARPLGPASTERRGVVRDKYIRGEITGADTNDSDQGTVSEIGQ